MEQLGLGEHHGKGGGGVGEGGEWVRRQSHLKESGRRAKVEEEVIIR